MRIFQGFAIAAVLAGCSDPLAGVPRLSDVDVADTDPVVAALPDAAELEREGFFGTDAAKGDAPSIAASPAASTGGGFFSRLISSANDAAENATPPTQQTAALAPISAPPAATGPDAQDVAFGTVLPFGSIARVCEAKGKPLGSKVDVLSKRGLKLYDSAPNIIAKRTFYITGYTDGCPRQFTAATALFGSPSLYEQLRFSPAGKNLPHAATDVAYDGLKRRVCGSRKNKPCGKRVSSLDKTTVFVSAYEFYGDNARWSEFLVHSGRTLAVAIK
ncbi:hypothetical protein C1J03_18450 [Sulfitobacter sp. SK012]|uniref:hypothetical protein n=1 Tax=Sulfitobacter sp. SK012 TaxID=1389005 RepID=UPI000E0B0278|nr:hypothetical protein [Sulfitobacter sp. SK012]AXI47814.1 hypothetical protein C1J03_18450 [Sulfitobacter sp. SK012]